MKKLILLFAVIAITVGVYAQTDSTNRKTGPRDMNNKQKQILQNNPIDKTHDEGFMMQNGKMMMIKNGQTTILDHEMTLANGTKIMSDGTYIKKDGTEMRMKDGQHMDMSGNIIPIKTDKDKNMYLIPDTTMRKVN